jgi:hypothetical protein
MDTFGIIAGIVLYVAYLFISSGLLNKALHNKRNRMASYKELKVAASVKAFLICLPFAGAIALIYAAVKP